MLADGAQHAARVAVCNPVGKPDLASGVVSRER
jgi:hypothetical protein